MKKAAAILAVMVMVVSLVSLVFAAGPMKATIKSVDAKAGTVVYTAEDGKDMTMKADKNLSGRCYLRCVVARFPIFSTARVMLDVATPRCRAISAAESPISFIPRRAISARA